MAAGISPFQNRLLNIFVSGGAAVVIVGALFKIQHYPGSDLLLPIGLGIEALIFVVYACLPPDEHAAPAAAEGGNAALNSMDKMLREADITPTNLAKLSAGFQKLGTTVEKMGEIGDVVKATGDYTKNTKEAAEALANVKTASLNASNAMGSFSSAADTTKVFHEQLQVMTKNLGSLNTIYELELKESNNHLKVMNSFYGKLAEASEAMQGSADDAKKAQVQIAALANNLTKLNSIYGNMLTAMQGR